MEQAGEIYDLRIHHHWDLWSADAWGGEPVKVAYYESDFDYLDGNGDAVVEDTKNPSTRKEPYYRLKRRLFKAYYRFDITEVLRK